MRPAIAGSDKFEGPTEGRGPEHRFDTVLFMPIALARMPEPV